MACPHVSGVIALGLSYAADLRKHFKADEIKKLLYDSCTDFDNALWNATKYYYKYVADLGDAHYKELPLGDFKGKMGVGNVNADAFLQLIAGSGVAMTFPNVYVAKGGQSRVDPAIYFEGGDSLTYSVTIDNEQIATCEKDAQSRFVFKGVNEGQTTATITAGSVTQSFVITVRESANNIGWL